MRTALEVSILVVQAQAVRRSGTLLTLSLGGKVAEPMVGTESTHFVITKMEVGEQFKNHIPSMASSSVSKE